MLRIKMVMQVLSFSLLLEGILPRVFKLCCILWAEGLDNVPRSSSVLEHWYPGKYLSFPMIRKCQFKIYYLISPSSFFFFSFSFLLLPFANVCVYALTQSERSHGYNSCTELRLQKQYIQCDLLIKLVCDARHNTNI